MKIKLSNFLLPVLLTLAGCSADYMNSSEAQQWISAYSPELIDPTSKIRIEQTDSLRKYSSSKASLDNIFHFSPNVKGEASFVDGGRFIDFYPNPGELKEGKEYECRVDMSRLTGIDTLGDFAFRFHVAKREVKMDGTMLRIDPNNVENVIVTGKLVFSHQADDMSSDARLFTCSEEDAQISIIRTSDEKVLDFVITNVPRMDEAYTLSVQYSSVTSSEKIRNELTVPGLKEFKLLASTNMTSSEPYVSLEFTAPLDPRQDLDGLITMDRCDVTRIERNGASVRVFYHSGGLTRYNLTISDMVRSCDGRNLKADITLEYAQEVIPPAIEVPMSGSILPDGNNLIFPFRAVNLAAVDVEVVKIYSDNVLHYLQDNEIEDDEFLRRAGRLIYKRTVRLDQNKSLDLQQWQNFSIDLNGLFKQERSAIYNVRLSFRKAYSLYDRREAEEFEPVTGITAEDEKQWDETYSYISRSAPDYNWYDYSWHERDDPSKDSYYMVSSRMPEYNLLASNLGLIVKKADNQKMWTTVSDIMTAAPLAGVKVTAYNYQLREVGSGRTDAKGFADFQLSGKPFIVTATDGVSTSYLKVTDGKEKSTSLFDVSGKSNPGGIKGYIYGERGIWRPGDHIYLTLVLDDKLGTLPANHPVTMELYTPDDVLYDRQVLTKGVNGFYSFCIKTDDEVETGRWGAKFHVGGTVFNHPVQIESIKPNRLKINMDLPEMLLAESETEAEVNVSWLTGVIAKDLKTNLEVTLYNNDRPFSDYPGFRFSNPLLSFSQSTYELGSGTLDSLGHITLAMQMPRPENAPGMLQANVLCRVQESGGDESVRSQSVRYSPFTSYVGIDLSEQEYETDKDLLFPVVSVGPDGENRTGRRLEWKIYKLQWQWWWEGSAENLSRYVNGKSAEIVASGEVITKDGKAEIPFRVDYPSYGKYLIFVRDAESKHASGGVIWVDWPQWRGRSDRSESNGASILSFSMDKNKYEVGETALVYLPASTGGRVLLSVENGTRVISRQWVTLSSDKETAFKLKISKEMVPNFYVHATLLQPHSQTMNDLPIRLYGIQGAEVIDPNSFLHPLIDVADEVLPQKEFTVKVREQNGRPMTYTLAIVDEGLLDINGFRTPNAWRTMNMREALGVDTWDIYDNVIGAYAGKFTSVLSIGGDEALRAAAGKEKRFNPVVKFMGPFTSDGGTRTHKITLPMYVGSVRVMVVAAQNGAYGSAEKNVAVRSPLMLLSTLPRVLSCRDVVNMPVNIFVYEEDVKDVEVSVVAEGPVRIKGQSSQKLSFTAPGEQMLNFAISADSSVEGMARITIHAQSGNHTASETINIEVRNPHDVVVDLQHKVLDGGVEKFEWDACRCDNVSLEVSALPSINFENVFSFVKNYPHFCTEQLSSRAMFLLYGRQFLPAAEQKEAEQILRNILKELVSRQYYDGGFRYWNTSTASHQWATSMAGEVMTEALSQGFAIPADTYQKWVDYQIAQARKYAHSTTRAADLQQAYRLYTLAIAGKEQMASMNRLKESKTLSEQAKYRLAATYYIIGKTSVAEDIMMKDAIRTDGDHSTFWSRLRDDAMKLEALVLMDKMELAMALARQISQDFSSPYLSTQEVAFMAPAFSRLLKVNDNQSTSFTVSFGDESREYRNIIDRVTIDVPTSTGALTVRNETSNTIYVSMMTERQPSADEVVAEQTNGASISVVYTDLNGSPVNLQKMKQGDEIYADIVVRKKDGLDSDSMALTFRVPSGWEIWNERINNDVHSQARMDIRDDRVCWYFSLNSIEKKSFRIKLRAAYEGEYILPSVILEDMYRADCRACTESSMVVISK